MSEQYETIDGKILIDEDSLAEMLEAEYQKGWEIGCETEATRQSRFNDVGKMFANAKPRKGRKHKKLGEVVPPAQKAAQEALER